MHIEQLITMANDIANFFQSATEEGEAVQGVAVHLRRYWEPRMRKQIIEHDVAGGEGLNALARSAIALLKTESTNNAKPV
ncbi:MAG: formate dehydrogenase subunit delta [Steroidobacteraceae bacterium]